MELFFFKDEIGSFVEPCEGGINHPKESWEELKEGPKKKKNLFRIGN